MPVVKQFHHTFCRWNAFIPHTTLLISHTQVAIGVRGARNKHPLFSTKWTPLFRAAGRAGLLGADRGTGAPPCVQVQKPRGMQVLRRLPASCMTDEYLVLAYQATSSSILERGPVFVPRAVPELNGVNLSSACQGEAGVRERTNSAGRSLLPCWRCSCKGGHKGDLTLLTPKPRRPVSDDGRALHPPCRGKPYDGSDELIRGRGVATKQGTED